MMKLKLLSSRPLVALSFLVAIVGLAGEARVAVLDKPLPPDAKGQPPLQYWCEARKQPRPLQVHCVKADLRCPLYEPVAIVADDPDGPGPAESKLEPPAALAARHRAIAAVNTNAFALLPGKAGMVADAPANIVSWAVTGGKQASPPQQNYWCFWLDPKGGAHVGNLAAPREASEAVAGFGSLLVGGQLTPREGGPQHPRTALGLDREARWLFLVVVDGRQAGHSEGITLRELAALMGEIGCWEAINLDGGGSSIMLLAADGGELKTVNRPSDRAPVGRPVPVMLGIRPASPQPR